MSEMTPETPRTLEALARRWEEYVAVPAEDSALVYACVSAWEADQERLVEAESDLAWIQEWSPQVACELRLRRAALAAEEKP